MDEKLTELLYRSFDGKLNPEELKTLEKGLSESKELRAEKQKIISLRQNIAGQKKNTFKPFFADRVMRKIRLSEQKQEDERFFEFLFLIFRPIAIAAAVLIIVIAGYNISTSGEISIESALAIPDVTLDDMYDSSYALLLEEEK